MTMPNVTRMRPKLSSTIRQHMPFTFGQKGFGTVVTVTFDFLLRADLNVLARDSAAEMTLRGLELYRLKNKRVN